MGRPLRSLLLLAALSFWLSSASAFCVPEAAYEYVMRGSDPARERSLPCCAAAVPFAAGSQHDRLVSGDSPASGPRAVVRHAEVQVHAAGVHAPPLRWRAYCERSRRLLL